MGHIGMGISMRILESVMPKRFLSQKYERTKAYKFRSIPVKVEHCLLHDQDNYKPWPGEQKNVFLWVELENGYAVGWNENPDNGWSFPVFKMGS